MTRIREIEIDGAPVEFEGKKPDAEGLDGYQVLTDRELGVIAGGGTPTAWPPH